MRSFSELTGIRASHGVCFCLGCLAARRYHRLFTYGCTALGGMLLGLLVGGIISETTDVAPQISMPSAGLLGALIAVCFVYCYLNKKRAKPSFSHAGLSNRTVEILAAGANAREQTEKEQQNTASLLSELSITVSAAEEANQDENISLTSLEARSQETRQKLYAALGESDA